MAWRALALLVVGAHLPGASVPCAPEAHVGRARLHAADATTPGHLHRPGERHARAADASLVPTADPDRRGGSRLDALLGLNVALREGPLRGHRLAFEVGGGVWQHLDGPHLETDWRLVVGWQLAF